MLLCLVKVQFGVFEESPDASCDEPFEASCGFSFGFAFAGSTSHVVLRDRAAALSGDGNEAERSVELAIAASVEPMPVLVLAGGDLYGSGAAESGVRGFAVAAAGM